MIDEMKQALEALKFGLHVGFDESSESQIKKCGKAFDQHNKAITALRQAIQEATLQEISDIGQEIEPVAYLMDGELFTAAEYQAITEQGDGAQPLYAVLPKREIEQTHTDHPARHWDRTCPACVAEAEKQEPVAWLESSDWGELFVSKERNGSFPVYTAPPKREWQGLTYGELDECQSDNPYHVYRAIETKLKEKNT